MDGLMDVCMYVCVCVRMSVGRQVYSLHIYIICIIINYKLFR